MKHLALVILTVLYMAGATGATVNIHYCMGELVGSELGHDEDQSCNSCGMEKSASSKDDCCRDEHKVVKVDDVHKSSETLFKLILLAPAEISHQSSYTEISLPYLQETYPVVNAPPAHEKTPVYLSVRSIRI